MSIIQARNIRKQFLSSKKRHTTNHTESYRFNFKSVICICILIYHSGQYNIHIHIRTKSCNFRQFFSHRKSARELRFHVLRMQIVFICMKNVNSIFGVFNWKCDLSMIFETILYLFCLALCSVLYFVEFYLHTNQ